MKKVITKVLSVFLTVVIMLTVAPLSGFVGLELPKWLDFSITSSAAETSGTCGKNLTWFFNEYSGTLTISGAGEMDDFKPGYAPWDNQCDGNIYKVIIGTNVTSIGWYAFYCCVDLLDVYYLGEEQQWNKILIGDYNNYLHHADIHCYSNDVSSLVADCSVGDIVEFGSYPQSFVEDSELYTTLNSLPLNWTSLEYYIGTGNRDGQMQPSDYMKYSDVVYNGIKYRAIMSTQYRPEDTSYISSTETSLQDEHGYLLNKVYWFKYEPLQWRVLDPNEGFVMCEKMIDTQAFNNTVYYNETDNQCYQDSNCEKYANDYATSSIREWLNDDFYSIAFTEIEKNKIQSSVITHYNYDYSYSRVSTTTIQDKIFLLSYDETKNESYGFSSNSNETDISRQAYGTDYARCQGFPLSYHYGEAWWFLRSSVGAGAVHVVNLFGYSDDYETGVTSICGIRPALKFNSKSDNPNSGNIDCNTNGHKESMAVVENLIAATCTADGSYDTVVYCSVCDVELSRVTTTVTATGHSYDNGVCTCCGESESNSDKKYYIARRIFDNNLDYYEKECTSSTYNPTLANMMAALSVAVYDKTAINNAQESMGFTYYDVFEYDSSYNPHTCGYSLAFKESDFSDDMICLVSVRGSQSLDYNADWIGNFEILTDSDGKHVGFSYPANNIYQKIQSYISKENITKNVKFFITGHSRGAAVANLLAVKLMENGISSENVYNYNFACPDVACKYVFTNYNNIFNLCNRADVVPLVPGPICSALTSPGTSWGKYGQTYWFTKEAENSDNIFDNHDYNLYLEFFDQRLNPSDSDWPYDATDKEWDDSHRLLGWITKIFCPVDVIITDENGSKIASVINGEINYYNSSFGDVIILTVGDKKIIYINDENDFNVNLIGTDNGTMTYSIEKGNFVTGEIYESKTFNDVALESGKTMYSPVSEAETTNDIQLFVTEEKDGELVYTHIINESGVEETYYLFSFRTPSRTEIRHKDGIILHANVEGTAPAGSYVKWTANNSKFKTEEINNGNSLKIVSDSNGYTTFTATLFSADGDILATDTIEMKSKAGFFDKIGSFFRSLFGSTKIYEN